MVDLEENEIEELEEPNEAVEEKKMSLDIYTPEELYKAILDIINQAKENGVEVKTEEFDFTKIYQLVVRIPKVEEDTTSTEEDSETDEEQEENI